MKMSSNKQGTCANQTFTGINVFSKRILTKYNKFYSKETKNGWSQIRRAGFRKQFYQPQKHYWITQSIKELNSIPVCTGIKILPEENYYYNIVPAPTKSCWKQIEIVSNPGYLKIQHQFLQRQKEAKRVRDERIKNRKLRSREGHFWDIRFLFKAPYKRGNFRASKYYLGYLGLKPISGPMTRAMYYSKLRNNRLQRERKIMKNLLFSNNLHPIQYNNILNQVQMWSQNHKSQPRPSLSKWGVVGTPARKVYRQTTVPLEEQDWSVLDRFEWGERSLPTPPPSRNIELLRKLRTFIAGLRSLRTRMNGLASFVRRRNFMGRNSQLLSEFWWKTVRDIAETEQDIPLQELHLECEQAQEVFVEPQMEEIGDVDINIQENHDVHIVDQRVPDAAQEQIFTQRAWSNFTTTEAPKEVDAMTNRDIVVHSGVWSTLDMEGKELCSINLPDGLLSAVSESPLNLMALQHVYMKFKSIVIKVFLSINPLMSGLAIINFYYGAHVDKNYEHKKNIYLRTQYLHAFVNAADSNPIELRIPYEHLYPFLCTKKRTQDAAACTLGILSFAVVNPLLSASSSDTKINYTIHASLEDCQFTGMVSRRLGRPQMEAAAAMMAVGAVENLLNNRGSLQNQDLPPAIAQPTPVQILPPGNLSYGTGIAEPITAMRLDARGQYPYSSLEGSDMLVSEFTRRYGLVQHFEITSEMPARKLIGKWAASPIWDKNEYPRYSLKDKVYRVLPPVAYISSLYDKWRGPMEFYFFITMCGLHRLSLLVAYVPGVFEDITYEQALASTYMVFSAKEGNQFSFETPYISDRVWWRRPYNGIDSRLDTPSPGTVYMFLNHPLSLNSVIPNKVIVNMFVRGGQDFELSIPTQPCISTCIYPYYKVVPGQDSGKALEGYYPYYVGTSRYCRDNTIAILRFGAYLDHIAFFSSLKQVGGYYEYSGGDAPYLRKKNSDGNWVVSSDRVSFAVANRDPDGENWWLLPVRSEQDAQDYITTRRDEYLLEYPNDDVDVNNLFGQKNYPWKFIPFPKKPTHSVDNQSLEDDCTVKITSGSLVGTNFGMLTFGESFKSLRDVLRRPSYNRTFVLKAAGELKKAYDINIRMTGMYSFSSATDEIQLVSREGMQALIGYCYRFFTGGCRVTLVFERSPNTYNNIQDCLVYIQHKFDLHSDLSDSDGVLDYLSQNYATHVVNIGLNPVVKIEIPYYLDSICGFLGDVTLNNREDYCRCNNLGRLMLWTSNNKDITVRAFMSFADDTKFFLNQGTYPIKFYDERAVKPTNVGSTLQQEDLESEIKEVFKELERPLPGSSHIFVDDQMGDDELMEQTPILEPEGASASKLREDVSKAAKLQDTLEGIQGKGTDLWSKLIGKDSEVGKFFTIERMMNILSQFGHMLLNPKLETIALSLASILVSIVGGSYTWIVQLTTTFTKYLSQVWSSNVNPQNDCFEQDAGMVTVLVGLVSSIVGYKVSPKGKFLDNMRRTFMDFNIFSRGLEGIMKLYTYLMQSLLKLLRYVVLFRFDYPDIHALLKDHGDKMVEWALHCEEILNPSRESEQMMEDLFVDVINEAYLRGTIYHIQVSSCREASTATSYLRQLVDRLREHRDKFIKMGKHPFTRVTPFSVYLQGDAGYGKSTLSSRIIFELLNKAGIKYKGLPFYKVEPGNAHWDTCNNEPCIYFDDAFTSRNSTAMDLDCGVFFNIVSNAPYTPPMAHLQNKFLRIDPKLMVTCSNMGFPEEGLNCPQALWRRRHAMFTVILKKDWKENKIHKGFWKGGNIHPEVVPKEEAKLFPWLQFKQVVDPRDKSSGLNASIEYSGLLEFLTAEFLTHYKRECDELANRIEMFTSNIKDMVEVTDEPEEITKSVWNRVSEYIKKKSEDMETFIAKNTNSFSLNFPDGQKLGQNMRWSAPKGFVKPQGSFTSEEVQDVKSLLLWLAAQHKSQAQGTIEVAEYIMEALTKEYGPLKSEKEDQQKILDEYIQMIDLVDKPEISEEDKLNIQHFLKGYSSIVRTETCNCHKDLCECYALKKWNDVEILYPTCSNCILEKQAPRRFVVCGDRCYLHNPLTFREAWKSSTIWQKTKLLSKLVSLLGKKLFTKVVSSSKKIAKSAWSGTLNFIKKTIKFCVTYITPILLMYFMGKMVWYETEELRPRIKQKLIDPVKNYVQDKIDSMVELYDSFGQRYLVPQGSVYTPTSKTNGPGKVNVRNLVVPKLAEPNMSIEQTRLPCTNEYIDSVVRRIKQNSYKLCVEYQDDGVSKLSTTRGIFIRNRQFLIVRHCWDELEYRCKYKNGTMTLVKYPTYILKIDLSKVNVYKYECSNFVVLDFPVIVQAHKNIIRHIPFMKQHSFASNNGLLITLDEDVYVRPVHLEFNNNFTTVRGTTNSVPVTMTGSYKYDFGGAGVCGSILLCSTLNPCIVGMHVAGLGEKTGYSEPLIKEMFEDVPVSDNDFVDIVVPDLKDLDESVHQLNGKLAQLGVVDAQFAHHEAGKTSIVPSEVHGIFPVQTEPVPLSNNDPRLPPRCSPMLEGVYKMGEPIDGFPKHLLDFARESLSAELNVNVRPVIGVDPISLQEAICGRPGIKGFSPLNFSTSEGFPFSGIRPAGASSKKWMFELELTTEGYRCLGLHPALIHTMLLKQQMRENDIMPCSIFVDCLKDERKPLEKVGIPGKTRIFSISPVDFSIQFRQYFLPYTVAHQNSRLVSSTAVGMNVNGPEWTDLVFKMGTFSPHQLCGDYSNFGSSFDTEVHNIVGKCILDWFSFHGGSSKDRGVRRVLLAELLNAYHLCFDVVYRTMCGMPSGSPITVETNDLVNLCYMLMAWHEIMSPHLMGSHYHFCKYVKIVTYGDDVWLSVSPVVINYFNNSTIAEFFCKYGVRYTDADKSGTIIPFKNLDEVSFLKRSPVEHPTRPMRYLAQLEIKFVLDIANWCFKSNDPISATLVNLEACSDSLYGHGPEVHTHYRKILQWHAHKLGKIGNFRSWSELDYIFLGEVDGITTKVDASASEDKEIEE